MGVHPVTCSPVDADPVDPNRAPTEPKRKPPKEVNDMLYLICNSLTAHVREEWDEEEDDE